ncbi:RNA polymerase sigma factor SigM [Streptomyces sp. NPDC007088]|uniref:RNA polymerase sigma factor SigM n=1 Tax=Streptomyces sp. NPDC007088 TaxID=3364773 RepID=UPI003687A925
MDEDRYDGVSDHSLLSRHVAGEADAFAELVRRHRDRLWAVALRTLGDREEAADAVQDALVSAYRAAHTFRGQSAVTTWLHRITVNACLDRARKAASRKTSPLDDTRRLEELLDPHESAEAPAERNDLHRELFAALNALPAEQRAALVLVDMQGYPVAEAARILDVAVGTVKSRCARGRARLQLLLAHLRPLPTHVNTPSEDAETPRRKTRRENTQPPAPRPSPAARERRDHGRADPDTSGGNRLSRTSVPSQADTEDPDTADDGGGRT